MNQYDTKRDTINGLFLKKLLAGKSLIDDIYRLKDKARLYFNRAKIGKNAHEALQLCKAFQLIIDKFPENTEMAHVLLKLWYDTYDIEHDDLFIIAAFENYAKAVLLSKRYVVHLIQAPNDLNRKQANTPIHINTIRAKKNFSKLYFKHNTISMSHLLKPNYLNVVGISDKAISALRHYKSIRNSIHFGGPKIVFGDYSDYEGLIDLRNKIFS
jgi:hypothetical protein